LKDEPSGLLTALWQARQVADDFRLPYDFFVDYFIQNQLDRGYKKIPRPNQFLGDKATHRIDRYVMPKWADFCQARQQLSTLEIYRNAFFTGMPDQIAHHDHLINSVRARIGSAASMVERLCVDEQLLPLARAKTEFPYDAVRELTEPTVIGSPTPINTARSCFGLPHASGASSACRECPHWGPCNAVSTRVSEHISLVCGSDDPVDAEQRRKNRTRVQRSRAKAALSAIATGRTPLEPNAAPAHPDKG
jgi:hypothetical protein